eukprot:gene4921-5402_t
MLRNDQARDNDEAPKREFTDGIIVSSQPHFSFSQSLPSSAPLVPSLLTPTIKPSSHNQIHTNRPVKAFKIQELDVQNSQQTTRAPSISPTLSPSSSVLIIGGTDGSGTRRVVQVLTELGVSMVSEDPETYDIHADLVKGWPPLVNPVINHFKSLDYDVSKSPSILLSQTRQSVCRLLEQVRKDSYKPQSSKLAVGGVLNIPDAQHRHAWNVRYGFKAPVAMTLLPFWADALPSLRFIHVLRDGRDIAFSANQGPVEKFYHSMYNDNSGLRGVGVDRPIQAIRLWSDWNSQVYHWAQRYSKHLGDDKNFGYLVVHSEDFVDPDDNVRLAVIEKMANFVGSTINRRDLCCMAMRDSTFLGSHDRSTLAGGKSPLSSRYGKWKKHVENNPKLSEELFSVGSEGLRIFGYHPMRTLSTDSSLALCEVTEEDCKSAEDKAFEASLLAYLPNEQCSGKVGVDYKGGDLEAVAIPPNDPAFCCRTCAATSGCKFFTVVPHANMCYMKTSQGTVLPNRELVSGFPIVSTP